MLYHYIVNYDVSIIFFCIFKVWIYYRHTVDVSDDITYFEAMRGANDKMFWCFDISVPTIDMQHNGLQRGHF